MSRSVPRSIDRKGEHLSQCDVCGVMWLRSALRRGADGLLRCENDRDGRDALTLAQLTAARAAALSQRLGLQSPADGARPDVDSNGDPSSTSSYTGPTQRLTITQAYNGSVPTGVLMGELRKIDSAAIERADRIVALLTDVLEEAKKGNVTGVFMFTEDRAGSVTHSRDGMPDSTIIFWLELVKRRILEAYE